MRKLDPLVSVVIPAYQRPEGVRRLIESVLASSYHKTEIVIMDDAADPETERVALATGDQRVHYFAHPHRTLTAGALNDGIRASKGDILVLGSDDLTLASDAIEKFVRRLETDTGIGFVGALVYYRQNPDRIHTAGLHLTPFARRMITIGEDTRDTGQYTAPYEVTIVDACIGVRRSVLDRTGLIDSERLPFYHDLTSLQFIARRLGYRIIVDPSIKAWHDRPMADRQTRALVSPLRSYYMVRSRIFLERDFDDRAHRATFALSLPLFLVHFLLQTLTLTKVPFSQKRSVVTAMVRGLKDGLLDVPGIRIL